MQSLSSLFQKHIQSSVSLQAAQQALVLEKANELLNGVLGEHLVESARAVYTAGGILSIACLNTVVVGKIKLNEAIILAGLNQEFTNLKLTTVRYLA